MSDQRQPVLSDQRQPVLSDRDSDLAAFGKDAKKAIAFIGAVVLVMPLLILAPITNSCGWLDQKIYESDFVAAWLECADAVVAWGEK